MDIKSAITILCLLFFGILLGYSQEPTDAEEATLQQLLRNIKEDYYAYRYSDAIRDCSRMIDLANYSGAGYYQFRAYNELGHIHNSIKDTAKARFYYEKSLEVAMETGQDSLLPWAYNDLANAYSEDIENHEKMISLYKKAIAINKKQKAPDYQNLVQYMNIAWTYLDLQMPAMAYPYLIKTQELAKQKKQHDLLLLNLDLLFARYYFYSDADPSRAVELFEKSAVTAEANNYLDQLIIAQKYLSEAYENLGDFKSANARLRSLQEVKERLHLIEKETQLLEASSKFEVSQYKKDLDLAQREEQYSAAMMDKSKLLNTIFIICAMVFLLGFITILFFTKNRKKYIAKLREKNAQLTEAKNRAEELSTLKTQFFSTVSHEIRTPLYGVVGLSSILLEDEALKSHHEDLTSLKFSADYLLALINDVLLMNKMESSSINLEKNSFSLQTLLSNIVRSFAFGLEQNNNQIHISIDDTLPDRLMGDSIRLSQILMNLVGNAVKFNENGNIWINIRKKETKKDDLYVLRFEVKDDGIGIADDKQELIFEEFSQVESNNYDYQGTGLGLPIVKKLLALYGSKIELESALGKGSTFAFDLSLEADPAYARDREVPVLEEVMLEDPSAFEDIHILIVDDNKINQKITQKILQAKGFQCSLADDGGMAVARAEEAKYNLILMDIHMPMMDGIEATRRIRKFDSVTPIVALTAVEASEIRSQIQEVGMDDIILKPYDVSQFLNTILRNLHRIHSKAI
ncbi:tetratricopeptide repeat-containing hybrid sensor histidine kinase/response regulator [Altibacter sp. HG106]|uniref:tetratricopeptide repeat-containing hybrid sensor histidine kinase/response regulator n=1 Tax=Altibacter sp. HG106 TaxID=3023937 RepID=UPI0023502003|nr:ATP-binding protein [Altibacter sp. HG106]MDC7995060.1 ATP-binding protein [Altibacter sp. HG106]